MTAIFWHYSILFIYLFLCVCVRIVGYNQGALREYTGHAMMHCISRTVLVLSHQVLVLYFYFVIITCNSRLYIFLFLTTMPCKNIGTNDKFCRKVALLRYTERLKFRSQSRETASKRKPYRGLGTRMASSW